MTRSALSKLPTDQDLDHIVRTLHADDVWAAAWYSYLRDQVGEATVNDALNRAGAEVSR